MRGFKVGSYQRHLAPKHLRHFCPSEALERIEDVDLENLKAAGKSVILLDVDNTLLPWRSRVIPQSTHEWLTRAKAMGFRFCVLSNTRHPERLEALTKEMEIDYVRDKFKPSTRMYEIAIERLGVKPEEAVMIGDQLLTDVLGANRAGIDAIWVMPMAKHEFVGTRYFSRNVERVVGRFLFKYFQADEDDLVHEPEKPGFFQHNIVREFAKFIVVGASSSIIDMGLHGLLMFVIHVNGQPLGSVVGQWAQSQLPALLSRFEPTEVAFPLLKVPCTSLAILNGFYWNRKWTFRVTGKEEKNSQLRRYFTVVLLGLILQISLSTSLNHMIPGHVVKSWGLATIISMVVVAFWNFAGSRFYVFRERKP